MVWSANNSDNKDGTKYLPRSYHINGHVMLNGEKMSKSTGNFLTLGKALDKYGTDAIRFALAEAGTGMTDANFTDENADSSVLKLYVEREWILDTLGWLSEIGYLNEFTIWDDIFVQEIHQAFLEIEEYYKIMDYQKVTVGIYKIMSMRDNYRSKYSGKIIPVSRQHIEFYIEKYLLAIYPICPHYVMHIWEQNPMFRFRQIWTKGFKVKHKYLYMKDVFDNIVSQIRSSVANMNRRYAKKGITDPKYVITITYFVDFLERENEIMNIVLNKGNIKEYIKTVKNKKEIGTIFQFARHVESQIEKYDTDSIKMDHTKIYNMLNEWINILCEDVNIKTINVTNKTDIERVVFKHNPFNPIVKVELI